MEKLLFLDMDGAGANSLTDFNAFLEKMEARGYSLRKIQQTYTRCYKDGLEAIFPEKAALVSKIVRETGAKIVWSTSWRLFEPYLSDIGSAQRMMNRRGMPGDALIGYTPLIEDLPRADEIKSYLEQNFPDKASCRCAVLDDMAEAGIALPANCRFFKTSERLGLTPKIAEKIIRYLNTGKISRNSTQTPVTK